MSAVMTTASSLPANVAKSTGAPTVAPKGTMLSMAAAEQRMNRTPTAIAFPLYDFIVSRLHCRKTGHTASRGRPAPLIHARRPHKGGNRDESPCLPDGRPLSLLACLGDSATSAASRSRGGSTGCRPFADYRISACE